MKYCVFCSQVIVRNSREMVVVVVRVKLRYLRGPLVEVRVHLILDLLWVKDCLKGQG